ncbi:MAG: hypothetical protein ACOC22_03100 [bacterium]
MTDEQIKKGLELQELIKTTSEGLEAMQKLRQKNNNSNKSENSYDDKAYFLSISEYHDGSGIQAKLTRYCGNAELLDTIIDKLEEQLKEYMIMFENL